MEDATPLFESNFGEQERQILLDHGSDRASRCTEDRVIGIQMRQKLVQEDDLQELLVQMAEASVSQSFVACTNLTEMLTDPQSVEGHIVPDRASACDEGPVRGIEPGRGQVSCGLEGEFLDVALSVVAQDDLPMREMVRIQHGTSRELVRGCRTVDSTRIFEYVNPLAK